jgi:hypothetical protein
MDSILEFFVCLFFLMPTFFAFFLMFTSLFDGREEIEFK